MPAGIPAPGELCRPVGGDLGLITCIVRNANGDPRLLSCSHVLASTSSPSTADVVEWLDTTRNPPVWQRAGTLWKWVQFVDNGVCNSLDVALAILDSGIAASFQGAASLEIAPYDNKFLGAAIQKFSARCGGWESGSVRNLFTTQDLKFGSLGQTQFTLGGLIECRVGNGAGDSGGMIVVDNLPLAIHIAGDAVDRSWSIPLQRAFDEWSLDLLQFE